ncbi:hypothetical protein P167DRAFT_562954 [Morchella conica CCBAS932]|uniref:Uncharacterized protein n=1 Tax=Morchella conica CCBAS932 TaxID=1392247 RepID=A0A3N4KYU5_9PEZI|nr:hypothetical protein P167DRAFT_562954 [Morchella conica CCBAS932]
MPHIHFRASLSERERGGSRRGATRSKVKAFFRSCFCGHHLAARANEKIPNARAATTTTTTSTATTTARFRPLSYDSTTTTTTTTTTTPPPPAAPQPQPLQPPLQPQLQPQLQPPLQPQQLQQEQHHHHQHQPPTEEDQTPQFLPPIRQTTPISLSGTTIQAKPLRKPWKHLPRPTLKKHHTYTPTHHHRHPHRSSLKSKLPLLSFPPEIILLIASHLDPDDQHALLLSSRALAVLITPLFQHSAMAAQGFNPALDFPPLHWAAWKGHTALVRQLLEQGHDANARTLVHGTTPLHHAARWGHEGVVRVLLHRGAEVDAQDTFDGKTPLHLARLEGRVEAGWFWHIYTHTNYMVLVFG